MIGLIIDSKSFIPICTFISLDDNFCFIANNAFIPLCDKFFISIIPDALMTVPRYLYSVTNFRSCRGTNKLLIWEFQPNLRNKNNLRIRYAGQFIDTQL